MAPLWHQKFKDECKEVERRARSRAERKRDAAAALKLNDEYGFDKWVPTWARKGSHEQKVDDEEDAEAGPGVTHSTRLIVAELQRIGVPATSDAADKIVLFHEAIMKMSMRPPFEHARIISPPVGWC